VPLSLAHGWRAGIAHLLVVAGGWAYNLGLKATALSWVPYATSFGLLGAFISLGLPGHPAPQPWVVAAGSLLGVGAHFLNVVPDLADDLSTGVRGLPHRLGRRGAQIGGALLLAAATIVITFGPPEDVPPWAFVAMALALVLAAVAAGWPERTVRSRAPFLLALGTAAVAVLMLVARGSSLA
jgi:4-hydroxybenzoate polyprenyltransferase